MKFPNEYGTIQQFLEHALWTVHETTEGHKKEWEAHLGEPHEHMISWNSDMVQSQETVVDVGVAELWSDVSQLDTCRRMKIPLAMMSHCNQNAKNPSGF